MISKTQVLTLARICLVLLALAITHWYTWSQAYRAGAVDMLSLIVDTVRDTGVSRDTNNCRADRMISVKAPL